MRKIKFTTNEKEIESALIEGEYININKHEFESIARAVATRQKNSVLNIRINSGDLKLLKKKAQHFGIRYQTFISELLHRVANG